MTAGLSAVRLAFALVAWSSFLRPCAGIASIVHNEAKAESVRFLHRGGDGEEDHRFGKRSVVAASVAANGTAAHLGDASPPVPPLWFSLVTRAFAFVVLASGVGIWLVIVPYMVFQEHRLFRETEVKGSTFSAFLSYRFNNWVTKEGAAAMSLLLMIGCITEVTVGALTYWATTGKSPFQGMWLVFLWMSASSVEGKVSAAEKIIGGLATVGGLLLLALLLGTVTDYLAARMEVSKAGRDPVVEGGHTLVIGYSSVVGHLLKEIAEGCSAKEKQTIVLLGDRPKEEITQDLANQHISTLEVWKRVRLVTRTGQLDNPEDLQRVCAGEAARIVIPPDAAMSREEADAKTFGILMTLRNHNMPSKGHVTAQCAVARNMQTMKKLHDHLFALSAVRLGVMMTQSSRDHGLCQVFTQLIGFDGDEFYFHNAKDFGVAGKRFKELAFCFPAGVPMGYQSKDEKIILNPPLDYEVDPEDEIIVMQEDEDAVEPFVSKYFDVDTWLEGRAKEATFCEENPNDQEKIRVLMCNFQEQGCSISVLFGLEDMCAEGSEVVLYTSMPKEKCDEVVEQAQLSEGRKIQNFTITVYCTRPSIMTSFQQIDDVMKEEFEHIFVLADCGLADSETVRVDQKTLATVLQMKEVTEKRGYNRFDPVVEICSSTAGDQLESWGVHNIVNTNLIMQRALAMVTVNKHYHGVLRDLLSSEGNCFDLQEMKSYMPEGEEVPEELNFAEATAIVHRAAQQVLVGWTHEGDYVLNPKDKETPRKWEESDKLLVIKSAEDDDD